MVEQNQDNNTAKEWEDRQKNRTKATFSLLDHCVKVYNDTETYIKRSFTLFGLGSIIAGASFSFGQGLSNNQVTLPQNTSDAPTSTLSSTHTPPQPVNLTPQPQIIYITPPPTQSITVQQPEVVVTSPTSVTKNTSPIQQPEVVVTAPTSTPQNIPTAEASEPVVASPSTDSILVPEELSQVKQAADSLQQISGVISSSIGNVKIPGIKRELNPLLGDKEEDD